MKSGIYEASFTTNQGTLGTGAVLIKNGSFAGADGLQFFRGEIEETGDDVSVVMEVTRHNLAIASAFGAEPQFTLTWRGKSQGDSAFRLACEPPGVDITIYVTGRLIKEAG
ncbi:MAG: GrlR family regulatory protein [Variovorax sp.]